MRSMPNRRCMANVRRRPVCYRPQLHHLEDRLPPGDALLSALLGPSLLGLSLAPDGCPLVVEAIRAAQSAVEPVAPRFGSNPEAFAPEVAARLDRLLIFPQAQSQPRKADDPDMPTSGSEQEGAGSATFPLVDSLAPSWSPRTHLHSASFAEAVLPTVPSITGPGATLSSLPAAGTVAVQSSSTAAWAGPAFKENGTPLASGPANASSLHFDSSSGLLVIRSNATGDLVQETASSTGFLDVTIAGQHHSSDPASAFFDPGLAGAGRASLTGIRLEGNGNPAPLQLGAQTLDRGLTVRADGPVLVMGNLAVTGPLAISAATLTIRGNVRGQTVDLASSGLLNVETRSAIAAGQGDRGGRIALTAGAFINTGSIQAGSGEVVVRAGNILNGGRITANGGAQGGTVSIGFTGSYIDTATAMTSAQGDRGGSLMIDGGTTGRLFSSGTQQATGRSADGGTVVLLGREVVLDGATVDASGAKAGGTVNIGESLRGVGSASSVTVTAASVLRADSLTQGTGGHIKIWAKQSTAFFGANSLSTGGGSLPFRLIDPHPTKGGTFGLTLTTLSDGNVLVTNPADNFLAADAGAVYLFDGRTGALLSDLVGNSVHDRVGDTGVRAAAGSNAAAGRLPSQDPGEVTGPGVDKKSQQDGSEILPLANGNYVVVTPNWNSGFGAVTWGDGTVGVTGTIDDSNSLVGRDPGDQVGSGGENPGVTPLSNGNYVVSSPMWNNSRGAVTWGDGTMGIRGAVSPGNSLVGTDPRDQVGSGNGPVYPAVTALANGNYVVVSPNWKGRRGAVTWGDGTVGISGFVDGTNSLIGNNTTDLVGFFGATALTNGNYVVDSPDWSSNGAVTWADGTMGISGTINAGNSLIGTAGNPIGDHVTALTNGNYVVSSPRWMTGTGAATWGDGTMGVTGTISQANSLIGSARFDNVGFNGITALSNGNYVVYSPGWSNTAGAVTWGDGTAGTTGMIGPSNSLVGSHNADRVGSGGITVLANGNYVVRSPDWNSQRGAATWGDGTAGVIGVLDASNSLVGSLSFGDHVGSGGITALSNGNYVVTSPQWTNGRGAVTWGNGSGGVSGAVSAANSLVGSSAGDQVGGGGVTVLNNGNYVVNSPQWNAFRGAATWGDGTAGVNGTIGAGNSLIDTGAFNDPNKFRIVPLSNGNYVVDSPGWNGGFGAVTWGDGTVGVAGSVSSRNSLVGSTLNDKIGGGGVTALTNGNYVVDSPDWKFQGAVTWADGSVGITGTINANNSLVGSNFGEEVGSAGVTALSNGNYVVSSPFWNGLVGAATWADGSVGLTGTIKASNSLIGGNSGDFVADGGVTALANGNYVVNSLDWHGLGALTWGNGTVGTTGIVDGSNSLIG